MRPFFYDDDPVTLANGTQSVGNDKHRAVTGR